jgi:predicted MFS family arabinose efflux permease
MSASDNPSSSSAAPEATRANLHHLVLDIAWYGLAVPSTARFLSVYAIRLGATPMLLGWLAALPAIIGLATSSLASWWRNRYPDSIQAVFWPGVGFRLAFLLPALTPFFPAEWQPIWLVLAVTIPAIPQGIAGVIFLVILREGVDKTYLTTLMSRRSLIFNITVAVGTLVFGIWLQRAPFPVNYQVMFVAAFALSLMSLLEVSRVQVVEPEPPPAADHPPLRAWRSPDFRRVAFTAVIVHLSFFSILPIIPLLLVDRLGADEGFMSIFALAELAAAATLAALTDRIVRRLGNRRTIALGMIGTGLAALMLTAAPTLLLTLPAAALSGGAWTMTAISLFGFFSESTPADSVTRYSTVYNQIVMLSVFAGPMLGSQLASTPLGLTTVLLIGATLRLLAGAAISFDPAARPMFTRRWRLATRKAR